MEFIDVSAKTIEDAIAKGVAQLAVDGQELVETKEMCIRDSHWCRAKQ